MSHPVCLNEKQIAIWNLSTQFSEKEIIPNAAKYDLSQEFPRKIFEKACEVGLVNMTLSEEFGGLGLSQLEYVTAVERLAWGCLGITGAISLNGLICDVLVLGGSSEQKKKYISRIVKGEIAGYAVTEPGAGSDVASVALKAEKKGNHYVLNGAKTWISNATEASFFVVLARSNSNPGAKGLSFFIVEKDTPGFSVAKKLGKMGQRAFPAAELAFEDVKIPEANLIGVDGQGFEIAMKVFDASRPMVAALGVGLMQRSLDEALNYAKSRQAMGKPILAHQAISQKIAEISMRLEASRLMTYQAASLLDKGRKNTLQASQAKAFSADNAVWVVSEALQIFGGMGYSTEYPMEKLYRDAKVLQIYEGTSEIQKLIIARELGR